jgi:hypothetical protein
MRALLQLLLLALFRQALLARAAGLYVLFLGLVKALLQQ